MYQQFFFGKSVVKHLNQEKINLTCKPKYDSKCQLWYDGEHGPYIGTFQPLILTDRQAYRPNTSYMNGPIF